MQIFASSINFRENLPIQSLEKQGRAPTEGACLSHGGDHYDHRTDFQCHDSAGTEYSRCQEHCDKVTTEENPSEYNPANVKAADKLDQTTAVVENAQSKDQNNTSADANSEQQQQVTNEQIKKAVEKLNKNMMSHSEAVFGIHEATNRITIKS